MMNINLLPQENVRNKAPFYVGLFLLGMFIISTIVLSTLYLLTLSKIEIVENDLMSSQLLLSKKEGAVVKLKRDQAIEMQNEIAEIKTTSHEFTPLFQQVEQVVLKNNFFINQFELVASEDIAKEQAQEGTEESVNSDEMTPNGERMFPAVITMEGWTMSEIGKIVEELEVIDWIEQAKFENFVGKKDPRGFFFLEANLLLQVVPDRLPIKGGN